MTSRERFLATMRYQPRDRTPFHGAGGWPETIDRWKREGFDYPSHFFQLIDGIGMVDGFFLIRLLNVKLLRKTKIQYYI